MTDRVSTKDTELAIWRSGLVARKTRPHLVTVTAKDVTRAANLIRRVNLESCNGVPHWDGKLGRMEMRLTEEDDARHDTMTAGARVAIETALRDILTRGLVFKWYTDPRAGCAVRVSNTANNKDMFL